jgi:hypothetical protein
MTFISNLVKISYPKLNYRTDTRFDVFVNISFLEERKTDRSSVHTSEKTQG